MKHLFISIIFLTLINNSFSQTNCDLKENYGTFIKTGKVKFGEREFLTKQVVQTDSKYCFSGLVNNNLSYIDYLLTNFSSSANYQDLIKISDSLTLQKEYILSLKQDSLFNSVMTELCAKTIEKRIPKDSISMDKLLNIAVKYFTILELNEKDYYVGKVCAGLNGIQKTEKVRQPQIEAFCFSSILKNYQSEEFNMYEEFVKAIKELYKVNLGVDRNEKLLRAQGGMFLLMRNNENLKKMLKSEYEKNKENLPFILKAK